MRLTCVLISRNYTGDVNSILNTNHWKWYKNFSFNLYKKKWSSRLKTEAQQHQLLASVFTNHAYILKRSTNLSKNMKLYLSRWYLYLTKISCHYISLKESWYINIDVDTIIELIKSNSFFTQHTNCIPLNFVFDQSECFFAFWMLM